MSRTDLAKDILRLKMRLGEEVIGMLPEGIRERARERRREILQAVQDICGEFLAERSEETPGETDLKSVAID